MISSYLPYAITEMYCIAYAVTILFRLNSSIGSEHEVRELRNMIYSYLGMLSTDIFWAFTEDHLIQIPRFPYTVLNGITIMSISLGCFFWYKFVEDRLHSAYTRGKLYSRLINLPIILICVLDVISFFTGWIFYIDKSGEYTVSTLFNIQTAVNYFYLLIPTLNSAVRAMRTRSRLLKGEYRMYAIYMIAPLAAGMIEDFIPTVPVLALNIFMVIHLLFLMIQNMQIYNDALTDLNNRRRFDQFLEERLPQVSAEYPLMLFMLDINSFKSINDNFGHIEGDSALKMFAAVLKTAASRYNAFIARYGGDEFCLIINSDRHKPEDVEKELHSLLQEAQEKSGKYILTASIGYAVCNIPGCDPAALLGRADDMLYQNKKAWHLSEKSSS